jgi:hypothetical protein
MDWETVCHYIAQGVINIEEGYTTIEPGSKVYKAMVAFCEYANKGCIQFNAKGTNNAKEEG